MTVVADLMALALLKPVDADIMCGTAQRFGLPMGFGGPTAGYMATRDEFKRDMPGRIIGLSKDKYGTLPTAWHCRPVSNISSANALHPTSVPPKPSLR